MKTNLITTEFCDFRNPKLVWLIAVLLVVWLNFARRFFVQWHKVKRGNSPTPAGSTTHVGTIIYGIYVQYQPLD